MYTLSKLEKISVLLCKLIKSQINFYSKDLKFIQEHLKMKKKLC